MFVRNSAQIFIAWIDRWKSNSWLIAYQLQPLLFSDTHSADWRYRDLTSYNRDHCRTVKTHDCTSLSVQKVTISQNCIKSMKTLSTAATPITMFAWFTRNIQCWLYDCSFQYILDRIGKVYKLNTWISFYNFIIPNHPNSLTTHEQI